MGGLVDPRVKVIPLLVSPRRMRVRREVQYVASSGEMLIDLECMLI